MRGIFDPVVEGEEGGDWLVVVFLNFLRLLQSLNRLKISYLVKIIEFVQLFVVRECIIE